MSSSINQGSSFPVQNQSHSIDPKTRSQAIIKFRQLKSQGLTNQAAFAALRSTEEFNQTKLGEPTWNYLKKTLRNLTHNKGHDDLETNAIAEQHKLRGTNTTETQSQPKQPRSILKKDIDQPLKMKKQVFIDEKRNIEKEFRKEDFEEDLADYNAAYSVDPKFKMFKGKFESLFDRYSSDFSDDNKIKEVFVNSILQLTEEIKNGDIDIQSAVDGFYDTIETKLDLEKKDEGEEELLTEIKRPTFKNDLYNLLAIIKDSH